MKSRMERWLFKPFILLLCFVFTVSSLLLDFFERDFHTIWSFGGSSWIGKWIGESPWEKHAKGDEFIHVLKGTVEILMITSEGKKSVFVPEGNVFVVPMGHWHQQRAQSEVVVLGATPGVTDHSEAEAQSL